MKMLCSRCQGEVDIPSVSEPEVINRPGLSLIVVEHPQTGYCPRCDVRVAAYVLAASMSIVAAFVPDDPRPIIITKEMPRNHG